jgi:shikimate kinase|tara:strand:+ start:444 stop:956 length:513 start_codon:yes stop_codon:yes gene_type:complete
MNSKKNLVFLGMMGSGKSSVGSLISKKLNLRFIDIDNLIEDEVGIKISRIFNEKGEEYFRNLEEKITLKILKLNNNVISLGGGAFINDNIRKEVLSKHFSFWLNWNAKTLINRISKNKKRPVALKSTNIEIALLIKKRSKIYAEADFKINCNNLTKAEIVKKIIKIYEIN